MSHLNARPLFSSLSHRPRGFVHASSLASKVINSNQVRRFKDGPYGGTPLVVGEELQGESMTADCFTDGLQLGRGAHLRLRSVAQTAFRPNPLGVVATQGSPRPLRLTTNTLGRVGRLGLVDRDINGTAGHSGPFDKTGPPSATATYPALWNHDATQETRMVCLPDSQMKVRPEMEDKAAAVWVTASRSHINRDFRFNSQPLAVAFTDQECLGGIAWPNVEFLIHASNSRFQFGATPYLDCSRTGGTPIVSRVVAGGRQYVQSSPSPCWTSVLSPTIN